MTHVTIPNRPTGPEERNIAQILADFDAITGVINGNLDSTNFSEGSKNGANNVVGLRSLGMNAGEAAPGEHPYIFLPGLGAHYGEIKTYISVPTAGSTGAFFEYEEGGISFATACITAAVVGCVAFEDAGHTLPVVAPNFTNVRASPKGKSVGVTFQNSAGKTIYPQISLLAIGY